MIEFSKNLSEPLPIQSDPQDIPVEIKPVEIVSTHLKFIDTKHKAFCDAYLQTGLVGDAYQVISPYVDKTTAMVQGTKYLSKPEVKDYILQKLQSHEPTKPDNVVVALGEMMSATKDIVVDKELQKVPDNPTRLEAIKTVLKTYGVTDGGDTLVDARSVNINITPSEAEALGEFASRLEILSQRLMSSDEQSGEVGDVSN